MEVKTVNIELLKGAKAPEKQHIGDAAFDCYASEGCLIKPHQTALVDLGFRLELPDGYEAQIRPRSGNSLKTDIDVVLGTVDSNYRGIVKAIVRNRSLTDDLVIKKDASICQMVIQQIPPVVLVCIDSIAKDTDRGERGFGSTSLAVD